MTWSNESTASNTELSGAQRLWLTMRLLASTLFVGAEGANFIFTFHRFFWARILSLQSKNKHKHKPRQAYVNWNSRRWHFLRNTPRVNQTVRAAKESSRYGLSAEVLAAGETGTLMFGINQTSLKGIVWNDESLSTVSTACCSRAGLTWLIS